MESALRDMFKKERYYNPEESSNKSSETSPEELKLQNSDEPKKEEQATNEENITSPSNKKAESEPLNNADADTESFQHKALSLDITPTLIPLKGRVKRAVSLTKMAEERRYIVKPKDPQSLLRELLDFELELKTYCPDVYTKLVEFSKRSVFTPDEIEAEIEALSEGMEKVKYFQMIWPKDTREKIMDSLESYIFEVIAPKLMKTDEDSLALAQQFRDRMIILRGLINYEMLDIPLSMRDFSLYRFAIKEFEKITIFSSPLLKLEAFQNCTNHLINVYLDREKRNPDADELFPLMIFVVLNADIEQLQIHVDFACTYMRRNFALGQLGYLAINLKAVVQFLHDIDGRCLTEGKLAVKRPEQYY